jgi:glutamine---fructose-6-phosphate transaminase (isomerizing)
VSALAQMIQSQADAIDEMAQRDIGPAVQTLDRASRIFCVGTGTSQHAAELGALALERAGRDARFLPSWAGARFAHREGDAVIVITHTAETVFAVRTRAAAIAAGIPVVSIVGVGRTDWPDAITTVGPERSETYTVSYTTAVAVLARLAGELGGPDHDLAGTAAAVRSVLAAPGIDTIPMPARSLAIIGAGPWGVSAREGALKIREGARMLAEGFDAERFLHGNAVPYTASDGLVLLLPASSAADPDGLVEALGAAAAAEGMQVSRLGDGDDQLGPVLGQIPVTVRLQLLADRFATLRGQDPDVAIVGAWAGKDLWTAGS